MGAEEPLSWEQVPRHLSALQVDRVSYLLQEIYGIENKNNQETKVRACGTAGPGWPCSPVLLPAARRRAPG